MLEKSILFINERLEVAAPSEKIMLQKAIHEKANELLEASRALNKEAEELLASFYPQKEAVIEIDNQKYSTTEWATIDDYCREYQLRSSTVVTNWIKRKKIPSENIVTFPMLGGLKLIKKVRYV